MAIHIPKEYEDKAAEVLHKLFSNDQELQTVAALKHIAETFNGVEIFKSLLTGLEDEHLDGVLQNIDKLPEDQQLQALFAVSLIHLVSESLPESALANTLRQFAEQATLKTQEQTPKTDGAEHTTILKYRTNNEIVEFIIESSVGAQHMSAFLKRNDDPQVPVSIFQEGQSFIVHVPITYFTHAKKMELLLSYQVEEEESGQTVLAQDKHPLAASIIEDINHQN
jgi:hypothetical protein